MEIKLPRPGWLALATFLLLLVAALVALVAPKMRVLLLQRDIEQVGGAMQVERNVPQWLNRWAAEVGADWLLAVFDNRVKTVKLGGTAVDDAWIGRLAAFPEIEALDLSRTKVTDAGLADTAVGDEGLKALQECPTESSQLFLKNTPTSAAAVAGLKAVHRGWTIEYRDAPPWTMDVDFVAVRW